MKVWMIWLREEEGKYTWLEAAWTDDMTAENNEGWEAAVRDARNLAHTNSYEVRIQAVEVPGVHDLFDIPTVEAT